MKDYSQNGEQKIILEYFRPPSWPYLIGTFLSIGENDGEMLSNVRALALMGWKGICVEPAPVAFSKLSALYTPDNPAWVSDVKCVQAAITTQDGPVDFYDSGTHLKQGDTSLLSTTRPEELERWKKSGEVFTKTTVRGITFATLLNELGVVAVQDDKMPAFMRARFDFISIDAEGADYSILTQIDLQAVGCRMLCVETNGKDNQKFIDYCAQHGMRLLKRVSENLIFCA